ncbi:hypothetical protein TIFTF001_030452 [Ficus carica]|uniref:Uncharacterized protein n=1 Tax=Ficus carica TaxID=3494 RepID=A0AA88IZP7_FICCA|nr:hypothetical protein TIFTF001_030452 [Ficus carica]
MLTRSQANRARINWTGPAASSGLARARPDSKAPPPCPGSSLVYTAPESTRSHSGTPRGPFHSGEARSEQDARAATYHPRRTTGV